MPFAVIGLCTGKVIKSLSNFLVDIVQHFIHFFSVPSWVMKFFIVTSLALLTVQLKPQGINVFLEPKYNNPFHGSPGVPTLAKKLYFGTVLKALPFLWHTIPGWLQTPLVRTEILEDLFKGLVPVLAQI